MEISESILALAGIVGGLVGSILTVIITKLLDIFQKSKEHKYALQKAFFLRKLEAAEAAVSQWYVTASAFGGMVTLYERPPVLDKGLHPEVFQDMNQRLLALLEGVQQSSNQLAHSFLLYFDVDDSFWDSGYMREYFEKLSILAALGTELQALYGFEKVAAGTEYEEPLRQEIMRVTDQLKPELRAFVETVDYARRGIIDLLKQVRTEMKKFES